MVALGGGAVSYERGTPVRIGVGHQSAPECSLEAGPCEAESRRCPTRKVEISHGEHASRSSSGLSLVPGPGLLSLYSCTPELGLFTEAGTAR